MDLFGREQQNDPDMIAKRRRAQERQLLRQAEAVVVKLLRPGSRMTDRALRIMVMRHSTVPDHMVDDEAWEASRRHLVDENLISRSDGAATDWHIIGRG